MFMLFRAIFWIGIIVLLVPRASGTEVGFRASQAVVDSSLSPVIGTDFRDWFLQRLAAVKADIEAAERARAAHD
jgi:hypothetical protein